MKTFFKTKIPEIKLLAAKYGNELNKLDKVVQNVIKKLLRTLRDKWERLHSSGVMLTMMKFAPLPTLGASHDGRVSCQGQA